MYMVFRLNILVSTKLKAIGQPCPIAYLKIVLYDNGDSRSPQALARNGEEPFELTGAIPLADYRFSDLGYGDTALSLAQRGTNRTCQHSPPTAGNHPEIHIHHSTSIFVQMELPAPMAHSRSLPMRLRLPAPQS